jgi:F-type H+-transporting ATPase subunit a
MASPLAQFAVKPIIQLELFGMDVSITNSVVIMFAVTGFILFLFSFVNASSDKVPSRMHILCEGFYKLIASMIDDNIGKEGRKFVPLIFSLFLFILFCNLFGMVPFSYTVTSQIIVTFVLAMVVFFAIIIAGVLNQGFGFLSLFAPKGTPGWMLPLMIVIELFAFLARPVSLSLRLAANMVAGHVLLKVLAGFAVSLPLFAKIIPLPLVTILIGFEIFIAILQAYIFAILSCVYLSDAFHGH